MNKFGFVVSLVSLSVLGGITQANACQARATCINIQWCMNSANGREFAQPLVTAAQGGDGQGVGADASACQNKYGQSGPNDWGSVSAGCQAGDFAALGKKALGGNPGTCD
jgi:hypothetical protein